MGKVDEYVKASVREMKKVTWPTKKEAKNYTVLVIATSLAIAAFLGALDYVFSFGLSLFIKS
jgi:preprotein translocase subunit SecE